MNWVREMLMYHRERVWLENRLAIRKVTGNHAEENIQHSEHGESLKLRRISTFIMSVRQSARMEQLGSHCTDFNEI
jgi:hypothetical protein